MVLEKWCHYTCPTQGCPKVLLCLKKKKKNPYLPGTIKQGCLCKNATRGVVCFLFIPPGTRVAPRVAANTRRFPAATVMGGAYPPAPAGSRAARREIPTAVLRACILVLWLRQGSRFFRFSFGSLMRINVDALNFWSQGIWVLFQILESCLFSALLRRS